MPSLFNAEFQRDIFNLSLEIEPEACGSLVKLSSLSHLSTLKEGSMWSRICVPRLWPPNNEAKLYHRFCSIKIKMQDVLQVMRGRRTSH